MKTDIISPNWNIHPLTTLHYMLTWISGKTHPRRGSVSWSCVPCDLMSCWWYMVVGSTNWVCVQDTSRNEIFRIQDLMMYNDVQSLECTCTFALGQPHPAMPLLNSSHISWTVAPPGTTIHLWCHPSYEEFGPSWVVQVGPAWLVTPGTGCRWLLWKTPVRTQQETGDLEGE
jgi:hypothetical protein